MNYFIYIIIFLFGLIIGSFINCIIYRLHAKKSFWRGRSFCPHCKKQINWYDNIPLLSFFLLKGRCRHCQKKISLQYPLVEFITGILFVIVFWASLRHFTFLSSYLPTFLPSYPPTLLLSYFPAFLILARNLVFTAILIIIFLYDLKYYLILDKVSIPAIIIALGFNMAVDFSFSHLLNLLLAGVVIGGFFFLQYHFSKGKWIGGGDIQLGLLMGFMLGWPQGLIALALAYIIGAIVGIVLIILKKAGPKSQVPFGTFLTFTTFVILLWGKFILGWYLSFIF